MANNKDKNIEEMLLSVNEDDLKKIRSNIDFKLSDISREKLEKSKEKRIIENFNKLKFELKGSKLVSSEVYSPSAIYNVYNSNNGTNQTMKGTEIEGLFGLNEVLYSNFGQNKSGSIIEVNGFMITFKYFEIN